MRGGLRPTAPAGPGQSPGLFRVNYILPCPTRTPRAVPEVRASYTRGSAAGAYRDRNANSGHYPGSHSVPASFPPGPDAGRRTYAALARTRNAVSWDERYRTDRDLPKPLGPGSLHPTRCPAATPPGWQRHPAGYPRPPFAARPRPARPTAALP